MEAARAGLPRRRERTTDRPKEREHTWTLRDYEVATTNEEQVAALLGSEARTNEVGRANDRERRGRMATKGSEALARGRAGPRAPVAEVTKEEEGGVERRGEKGRGPVEAKALEGTMAWWRRAPRGGVAKDVAVWPSAAGTQQKERGGTKSPGR